MSKESVSALLHQLGNMVEQGCFDNISEEVIDGAAAVLKSILNVDVTFEQAKRITGKSESALRSKCSRSAITRQRKVLFKYREMEEIRDKKR